MSLIVRNRTNIASTYEHHTCPARNKKKKSNCLCQPYKDIWYVKFRIMRIYIPSQNWLFCWRSETNKMALIYKVLKRIVLYLFSDRDFLIFIYKYHVWLKLWSQFSKIVWEVAFAYFLILNHHSQAFSHLQTDYFDFINNIGMLRMFDNLKLLW